MKKFKNISEFKKQSINALVQEMKKTKKKEVTAYDVTHITTTDCCFYSLRVKDTSGLMVGGSCEININGKKYEITIFKINKDTVTIESEDYFGSYFENARIYVDESYLTKALISRIESMTPENLSEIAEKLLFSEREELISDTPVKIFPDTDEIKSVLLEDILFVWGPPGTGKTTRIVSMVKEYINQGLRVLLLSTSNKAVDEATLRVCKSGYKPGEAVRFGNAQNKKITKSDFILSSKFAKYRRPDLTDEEQLLLEKITDKKSSSEDLNNYRKRLEEVRKELKEEEYEIINSAKFVATTFCTACLNKNIYDGIFDVVIVDESSMAYIPCIVFAATIARKNLVCVGDFEQLLPVAITNNDILKCDIFQYCGITETIHNGRSHKWLYLLDVQYRMHSEIAKFLSENVYCNLLKTADGIDRKLHPITNSDLLPGCPVVIIDTGNLSPQKMMLKEGGHGINLFNAVVSVTTALKCCSKNRVGIITPYKNQADLINHLLEAAVPSDNKKISVSCSTVHKYQGSEKDIIIYDSVDSCSFVKPGWLLHKDGSDLPRRLFNVAMSRAKGKFIFVGDISFLKNLLPDDSLTKKFIKIFDKPEFRINNEQLLDMIVESSSNDFQVLKSDSFCKELCRYIKKAQSQIYLLTKKIDEEILSQLEKKNDEGVKVEVTSVVLKNDNEFAFFDDRILLYNSIPEENIFIAINNKLLSGMIKNALYKQTG
ncbi:MAG: AAA domain-containing protein [Acutalibacteraceae bacterium]|nr:AAA domain-containing protein [Acutalibacteraceae bacterium]